MRTTFLVVLVCIWSIVGQAQATWPSGTAMNPDVKDHPNDLSGLQRTGTQGDTVEYEFNTVVTQQKGRLYSSPEDIMKVLTGGIKNPTGQKELWKEGLMFKASSPCPG